MVLPRWNPAFITVLNLDERRFRIFFFLPPSRVSVSGLRLFLDGLQPTNRLSPARRRWKWRRIKPSSLVPPRAPDEVLLCGFTCSGGGKKMVKSKSQPPLFVGLAVSFRRIKPTPNGREGRAAIDRYRHTKRQRCGISRVKNKCKKLQERLFFRCENFSGLWIIIITDACSFDFLENGTSSGDTGSPKNTSFFISIKANYSNEQMFDYLMPLYQTHKVRLFTKSHYLIFLVD